MTEEEQPKKRGRPPGVKNGEGKSLEPIKNWTPTHDAVVMLHVALKSNKEIAVMVDLSVQRVGQILNDPIGKRLVAEHQQELRKKLSEDVTDGLASLCVRAVEILRETLEIDGLTHGSDFKKHQDNLAMQLLKGKGHLGGEKVGGDQEGSPLSAKLAERLVVALERSNEAERLAQESKEIVIEAEVVGAD